MLLDALGERLGEDEQAASPRIELHELIFEGHAVLGVFRGGAEKVPFDNLR